MLLLITTAHITRPFLVRFILFSRPLFMLFIVVACIIYIILFNNIFGTFTINIIFINYHLLVMYLYFLYLIILTHLNNDLDRISDWDFQLEMRLKSKLEKYTQKVIFTCHLRKIIHPLLMLNCPPLKNVVSKSI